jgi:hypothetical protein
MLLFKLPMDVYQEIMTELHYSKPREEEDKIRVQVENLQGARDSNGKSLVRMEGDGLGAFDSQPTNTAPVFEG